VRAALFALAADQLIRPATETKEDRRPEIIIAAGYAPEIVDAAERVLMAHAVRLRVFQRAGEVMRIIALERESADGDLWRPAGSVQLMPASSVNVQELFDRLISWRRIIEDGEVIPADCPMRFANTYVARGQWRLPHLRGIIEAPVLRPDGTVLDVPGYDSATGLYLLSEETWPVIPGRPTRDEAQTALRLLLEPFAEFPFVDDGARYVVVAAVLTAIQRRLLTSAPLFAFDAPGQRSGKSLLAESIGIITTGRQPAATGVAKESDELRKAITSALRENQPIVNLDNITRPLDSPDLARAITQGEYQDRLLGMNRMLRLLTNVLWTATGNNMVLHGDLTSRSLICRIDSQLEFPEERVFTIPDLIGHLRANRKSLVVSALTILRGFYVAGRPRQEVKPWGGFDQWSQEIREPLIWLGATDPCQTRDRIVTTDPDREAHADVLRSWHAALGERETLIREVITEVDRVCGSGSEDESLRALRQALLAVATKRDVPDHIDPRRLGHWLSSKKDRIVDGFRISTGQKIQRATGWKVSSVSCVSSKGAGAKEAGHAQPPSDSSRKREGASAASGQPEVNSPNSPNSRSEAHEGDEGIEV